MVYLPRSQAHVSFTLLSPGTLVGPANIAELTFGAITGQSSAFIPLTVQHVFGRTSDGRVVANATGASGRIVMIGPQPVLDIGQERGKPPRLTLYGNPGRNHVVEWKTNLFGGSWRSAVTLALTNIEQTVDAPVDADMMFFRATAD